MKGRTMWTARWKPNNQRRFLDRSSGGEPEGTRFSILSMPAFTMDSAKSRQSENHPKVCHLSDLPEGGFQKI